MAHGNTESVGAAVAQRRPLVNLRFGDARSAQVKVRRVGTLTIPDRVSAMVFTNIWIRDIYPRPRDGDVVLDIGANVGLFSVRALHPRATFCHCVEPCPDSVARLPEHFSRLGLKDRSNVMPVAIGVEAGTAYIPSVNVVSNTVNRVSTIRFHADVSGNHRHREAVGGRLIATPARR